MTGNGDGRAGRRTGRQGVARVAAAGLAGGCLGAAFWLTSFLLAMSRVFSQLPCSREAWGCLGEVLLAASAGIVAVMVLAWPLLRLAGVRPAWPVALAGPPVAFFVFRAYEAVIGYPPFQPPGAAVILALSYATAAFLTMPGAGRYRRAAVALAVIALYPLANGWSSYRLTRGEARGLAATGLPLLAPDLPGYRVSGAGTEWANGEEMYYTLLPLSAPPELTPSPTQITSPGISVMITRPGPGFAPPAHCATGYYGPVADAPPCRAAGRGLWWQRRGLRTIYFARHGNAVAELDADTAVVPQATLLKAARTLSPRDPSYFVTGP